MFAYRHTPRVLIFKSPQGSSAHQQQAHNMALQKLQSYLNTSQPKLARWLHNTWNAQAEAIKYQELRDAIIAGDLSLEYLKQWQQDYAQLVNEKLAPAWLDAMEAATEQLKMKYPEWVFDPNWPAVGKWVQDHGSELAVNLTATQHEALKQVINRAAFMGELGPDELSRCIRPLVGMVPREAQAVMNYYQALRKDGKSIKQAQKQAANYAARVHRHRAMRIARTELAFAYNRGIDEGIKQAQLEGFIGQVKKRWLTADDERVCEVCGPLDEQIIDQDASFGIPYPEKFVGMHRLPPAHPHCRCTVIYEEVDNYNQQPNGTYMTEQELQDMEDQAAAQAAMQGHVPPVPNLPDEIALDYVGIPNIGGAGKKYLYEDKYKKDGQFLFKPAISKGGSPEPFRAYVQEAASRLQKIVDSDSQVKLAVKTVKGTLGTLQQMIDVDSMEDLKGWQNSPKGPLSNGTTQALQREHVTDWLLGNFDGHGGNFVRGKNGVIYGVDKEQSFRYIGDTASHKMNYSYHPNAAYGETEPIYNTLFRRFAQKQQDIDLQEVLPYIKKIEAIPNTEYKEMYRKYAEALHGKGKKAEDLLDQIVDRKANLRETYREFYSELLKQRTGKAQKFVFMDEGPDANKQPLAATAMSQDMLNKMPLSQLKQMLKDKKVPYYLNMNKTEMVTALAFPEQAPAMSTQVRDRLKAAEANRQQRNMQQAAAQTKAANVNLDEMDASVLFQDFSVLPKDRLHGVAIMADETSVEGLAYTARKVNIGDEDFYEITGKITKDKSSAIKQSLARKTKTGTFEYTKSSIDYNKKELKYKAGASSTKRIGETWVYKKDGVSIEVFSDDRVRAFYGSFRIRVKDIGGAEAAKKVQAALKELGLEELCQAPTKEAVSVMKKMRLIWQNVPNLISQVPKGSTVSQLNAWLDKQLKNYGVKVDRIKDMIEKEVFPGYKTFVENGVLKDYKKLGAEYVWHGVPRVENMVKVLQSPGLLATNERVRMGLFIDGASSDTDMRTGGSDSVFVRIATKAAVQTKKRYSDSYYGHGYRIIIDPKELERTDWYAYGYDNFGSTSDSDIYKGRDGAKDFISGQNKYYSSSNELMFRRGIGNKAFMEIRCDTKNMKDELIRLLKAEGITEYNGKKLEDFIKVRDVL